MGIRFNARTSAIETDAASIDFTQPITTPASTTSLAGLNIAEAVAAPSAPVDGDVWVTAGGAFNVRLNGVTVDLAAGGGVTASGTPVDSQLAVWTGASDIEGDANLTWNGTSQYLSIGSDGGRIARTGASSMAFQTDTGTAWMTYTAGVLLVQNTTRMDGGNILKFYGTSASPRINVYADNASGALVIDNESGFNKVSVEKPIEIGALLQADTVTVSGDYAAIVAKQNSGTSNTSLMEQSDSGVLMGLANYAEVIYSFNNPTTSADPGAGFFRVNNASFASATELYVDDNDLSNQDQAWFWSMLNVGDILMLHQTSDRTKWLHAEVSSITDNTGWYTIGISPIESSGTVFTNAASVGFIVKRATETFGGTGQTTYATGDILYASGANTLSKLAAGTDTHVLTLSGGVPTWSAAAGGGNVSNTGTPVNNQLAIWTDATTIEGDASLTYDGSSFAAYGDSTAKLIDALDETFYDNSPTTEGTFSGGTGHAALDVITMSDGSTITVDAVSGGVVTEFTVETVTTTPFVLGDTLTQSSTTGSGASFTLTPDIDNVDLELMTHHIGSTSSNRISFEQGANYAQIQMDDADAVSTEATFTFDTNGSGAVSAIAVTSGGRGYDGSSIQFNITSASDGTHSGTEAIITATVLGDKIVSAVVTLAGSGYAINQTGTAVNTADAPDPNLQANLWFDITSSSTGDHQFFFSDGGYGNARVVFDLTNDSYFFAGGLTMLETTDHTGSVSNGDVSSGRGQIWVKQRSGGGELMYTEGDNDSDYTVQNLLPSSYTFDSGTTAADPGAGEVRFDNSTPASVTNIYINDAEHTGRVNDFQLDNLQEGDIVRMRSGYFNRHWIGQVDGAPTDNTGYWTIPVTHIDSSSLFVANNPVQIEFESTSRAKHNSEFARKNSDQTKTTDTTIAVDNDLQCTVIPQRGSGIYRINGFLALSAASTTPDIKIGVYTTSFDTNTSQSRVIYMDAGNGTIGDQTLDNFTIIALTTTTEWVYVTGVARITGATNVEIRWAQNTSSADGTTVEQGSYLEVIEVDPVPTSTGGTFYS